MICTIWRARPPATWRSTRPCSGNSESGFGSSGSCSISRSRSWSGSRLNCASRTPMSSAAASRDPRTISSSVGQYSGLSSLRDRASVGDHRSCLSRARWRHDGLPTGGAERPGRSRPCRVSATWGCTIAFDVTSPTIAPLPWRRLDDAGWPVPGERFATEASVRRLEPGRLSRRDRSPGIPHCQHPFGYSPSGPPGRESNRANSAVQKIAAITRRTGVLGAFPVATASAAVPPDVSISRALSHTVR
jgi:hypothetical protein